jgi:creatinine amidohydrolase/Fe(II)-dependent formamide hydrolase-like protein
MATAHSHPIVLSLTTTSSLATAGSLPDARDSKRRWTMPGVYALEALTAPELTRLVASGVRIVVVPFGSVEHQGGHLPIGADSVLADAVGREVARRLGAVLAPTLRAGCAEQHAEFAGTLTLRAGTLTDVAVELAESLARQGFTRIVLVSAHGGNQAALDEAVARLAAIAGGAVVCAPQGDVGPLPGAHSGQWLTSVMLALRPDLVSLDHAGNELADELREAGAERGAEHVERFVTSIVDAVPRAS